jgi:hypothetical protein
VQEQAEEPLLGEAVLPDDRIGQHEAEGGIGAELGPEGTDGDGEGLHLVEHDGRLAGQGGPGGGGLSHHLSRPAVAQGEGAVAAPALDLDPPRPDQHQAPWRLPLLGDRVPPRQPLDRPQVEQRLPARPGEGRER